MLIFLVTHKKEHSEVGAGMVRYFRSHRFLFYYSLLTAGFTEELTVRGYLLPRLARTWRYRS
jgi:membrane protease YdiL (CAAX protease family)